MIERLFSAVVYLLVPLAGILFFDWDWRSVIFLYWLQNITAGVRTEIDMFRTRTPSAPGAQSSLTFNGRTIKDSTKKPFAMMFFAVHYGIFTFVHGVFVTLIVYGAFTSLLGGSESASPQGSFNLRGILVVWAIGSLVQVIVGCFTPRESLPPLPSLFGAPYARIIALHVTVLLGVWLIVLFNWPPAAAILLVALQFIVELGQLRWAKRTPKPQELTFPPLR